MPKVIIENRVKEELSKHYSGILFHLDGYYILHHEYDDGVDLSLKFLKKTILPKSTFHIPSPETLDIQLKATTESKITRTRTSINYNIKVKSYNKLIERKKNGIYSPYVLILYILPEMKENWVTLKKNSLSLSNNAYWFIPSSNMDFENLKKDTSTISISIPTKNKLEKNTFKNLFDLIPV